jgi:hypothetical protein
MPTKHAISALLCPSAASSTIRARFTVRAGAVGKRSARRSFSCSLGAKRMRRALGPDTYLVRRTTKSKTPTRYELLAARTSAW